MMMAIMIELMIVAVIRMTIKISTSTTMPMLTTMRRKMVTMMIMR